MGKHQSEVRCPSDTQRGPFCVLNKVYGVQCDGRVLPFTLNHFRILLRNYTIYRLFRLSILLVTLNALLMGFCFSNTWQKGYHMDT